MGVFEEEAIRLCVQTTSMANEIVVRMVDCRLVVNPIRIAVWRRQLEAVTEIIIAIRRTLLEEMSSVRGTVLLQLSNGILLCKRIRVIFSILVSSFRREPAATHHRNLMNSPHENPPNPDVASTVVLRHPETECAWYYVDPQGNTQGPCTIAQFRSWLRTLAEDPRFADEYKQFMSVDVWKEGMQKKQLMTELLQHNNP